MDSILAIHTKPIILNNLELSRLLSAALVSREFCEMLLSDPGLALDSGFKGETFYFSRWERTRILGIRAENLREFASQLIGNNDEHLRRNIRFIEG